MARRRSALPLFASVLIVGLALVIAGHYLYTNSVGNGDGGGLFGFFKNGKVQSSLSIDVVSSNGTVVENVSPKNPLAIIAQFGSTSTDITKYMSAETAPGGNIYYFKLTPSVKPTFTVSSGTPSLKVDLTWSPVTVQGQTFADVYRGTRLNKWESPITLPMSASVTINNPVSGQTYTIGDLDNLILICITESLPSPMVGSSYTITGKVTIKTALLVDGVAQGNPITQEASYSITIKNQPDGTLSAVDVTVTINTVSGW